MTKLELNLDATALGYSSCMYQFMLRTIGSLTPDGQKDPEGAYVGIGPSHLIYGVASHKFIDTMYKTSGDYRLAIGEAKKSFMVPKISNDKKLWLDDPNHMIITSTNTWQLYIEAEKSFEVLQIPVKCWWCGGVGFNCEGTTNPEIYEKEFKRIECPHCQGKGIVQGPATELTFRIPFYEDDYIKIYICGTIDTVGKFKNGIYAIRDWKTSATWDVPKFLLSYAMSCQLRMYVLACKMMATIEPESILGRIGATQMGAFIDGIFLTSKPNDVKWGRTDVMRFSDEELDEFKKLLNSFCLRLSQSIQYNIFLREGILNGTCSGDFGYPCMFWDHCRTTGATSEVVLKRIKRKMFDPLNYNEITS